MSGSIIDLYAPDYACSARGPCGCELCELLAEAKQLQCQLAAAEKREQGLQKTINGLIADVAAMDILLAAEQEKNKRLREIVEIIMTQHWDMAACNCWVCTKGREAGCSPMEKYLPMRKKGSGHGRVTVEPDGKGVGQ